MEVNNQVEVGDDSSQMELSAEDNGDSPKLGMTFNSYEEVCDFFKNYARNKGFDTMQRRSKSEEGILRYFTLACAKSGNPRNPIKNSFRRRPSIKTDCKVRINATLTSNEQFVLSLVELDHNHAISPSKVRFYRGNKHLDAHVKKKLELNDEAGITLCKSFNSLVVEHEGYENLSFGEKECRNYIEKVRRLKLEEGDAEAIRKYFVSMHQKNPQFFYVLDHNDEGRLRNVFWADARSRAAYESFGDVVVFDATYLTNKYDMPFTPFVGVNHHGQSVLLGCGLLSNENLDTYVWLFERWSDCMLGCHPNAIITDQCKSIGGAIAKVFPKTNHILCRWHIMKKLPEKLGGFTEYKAIKYRLKKCVYDSMKIDEFEKDWREMNEDFKLQNNEWLNSLYKDRHRWVPVFTRRIFLAGMSASQRSESMNSFFDDFVHSKTSLKQFVDQYEKALKKRIEKEATSDFSSFNTTLPLVTDLYMEKQMREIYTNVIFKKFQDELKDLIYCNPLIVNQDGSNLTFEVRDLKKKKDDDGKIREQVIYEVLYNTNICEVQCICHNFEFCGILCRHALCVLMDQNVIEIPSQYILSRWRKDIKRPHDFVNLSYDELGDNKTLMRCNRLYTYFSEAANIGSESDDIFEYAKICVSELIEKLLQYKAMVKNEEYGILQSSNKLISPVKVRTKGRPASRRKESKSEKLSGTVKKKNLKRKAKTQDEQIDLSVSKMKVSHTQINERMEDAISVGVHISHHAAIENPTHVDQSLVSYMQLLQNDNYDGFLP